MGPQDGGWSEQEPVGPLGVAQVQRGRCVDVERLALAVDVQVDDTVAFEHQLVGPAVDLQPLAAGIVHQVRCRHCGTIQC